MRRPYPIVSLLLITCVFASFTLTTVIANRAQNQNGVLSGTVKDPNGAVVPGAQVTARHDVSGEVRNATTDGRGNFKLEKLAPGKYTVIVTRNGFKNAENAVMIEGERAATIEVKLEIAETRAEIGVAAKGTIAPNTDPNYRAMRDGELSESYEVTNLMLKRDVGVFTLKQGNVSFLPLAQGRVALGVFIGE